ncbi:aldolase/citrate lyase family protein [Actibacterium lipolyticum]|uniref:Hydroxypyruvate/pyruvate aldolase n=1 Tax=Actibacterium lipolyticum TaxID=1524263 RepID=A0A238KPU5_9RHOB|nr:aldolase/citrate lyase family protein [Actibacterium lipolyticum]SMX44680.1 4-hydroxy-2-oxo-heptane-1,7-dioate aldolase [Actibacterium lipolyticum]
MKNLENRFKTRLKAGEQQIGIWNSLQGNATAEVLATCGFDWMLIDTEHSAMDVIDVLPALQSAAAYPDCAAVVRPASNDPVLIKRLLDLGAQTLLIPYVQSVAEAEAAVSAMSYPPKGIRGVAGLTRASRFGTIDNYATEAEKELCLLVQVETRASLDALEHIASVDGVDGVFIGPADLAASLGHPGNPNHPEVVAAIEGAFARLKKIGVPAGILTLNRDFARRCIEIGTTFTAVGVDLGLLIDAANDLSKEFAQN